MATSQTSGGAAVVADVTDDAVAAAAPAAGLEGLATELVDQVARCLDAQDSLHFTAVARYVRSHPSVRHPPLP